MPTPFAPLLDTDVPYQPTPQLYTPRDTPAPITDTTNVKQSKQQMNSVIPPELSTVESRLKAEGSGTSTLSTITAWLGAAKGDFRGLQAIEDSKKRTALAKTMVPEITKVNKLVNAGKWDEASDYVNELASSYGTRADYLVPYFQQMQTNINKKQEGWTNLVGLQKMMEAGGANDPENINYRAYQALSAAVKDKTPISETNLQGFMTRYGAPDTQVIDGRVTRVSKLGGPTQTEQLPAVVKGSDMDNFAGTTVASKHGLNTKQLADVMNNLPVKSDTGETITPDSKQAQTIKTQFNALQPINAALEMAKNTQIPPEVTIQLLKDRGLLSVATRDFGSDVIDKALAGAREQDTEKQIAINKGTEESSYSALPSTGMVAYDTVTKRQIEDPLTVKDVKDSKGRVILVSKETLNNRIIPINAELDNLAQIPKILEGISGPQTRGETLAQGAAQTVSKYTGVALTDAVKKMQEARTMLNRAAEKLYNIAEMSGSIAGKDSKDMATLKQFMTGIFNTPQEYLKAAKMIEAGYNRELNRAIGSGEKTPVQQLAPVIPNTKKSLPQGQSQITRDPYGPGGIQIPPEIDAELRKKIDATGNAPKTTGKPSERSMRIEVGPNGTQVTPQSVPTTTTPAPNTATPSEAKPFNAMDAVKRARQQKTGGVVK